MYINLIVTIFPVLVIVTGCFWGNTTTISTQEKQKNYSLLFVPFFFLREREVHTMI